MISVVVCTYNRAELLSQALRTLCEQEIGAAAYEVIVVDNNSTDDTRRVVEACSTNGANIRYCVETEQGLSHARNRGWREARGEYVAYTDDDCKLPPAWLSVAARIIDRRAPGAFGGPYFAFYNAPKPRWFKDAYGSRELAKEARDLRDGEFLMGGNIFFRRRLLMELGGFDGSLGMAGQKVAYGEEVALQRQMRRVRPKEAIYYDPDLYVYHLVRTEKMTLPWLVRAFLAKGRDVYLAAAFSEEPPAELRAPRWQAARAVLSGACDLTRAALWRDRSRYPYLMNYFYERTSQYLRNAGRLQAQARRAVEFRPAEARGRMTS